MSLVNDLKRFKKLTLEKQERVVKGSFVQLGNEMALKSPVDTGRFRSSWFGAIGSPSDFVSDNSQRDAVGELSIMLGGLRVGDVFYYTNNMPYASALEYGHSDQAPSGVVRLTARQWGKIVQANIRAIK